VGPVPGAAWDTVEPTAAGLDPAGLEALRSFVDGRDSNCVAVIKDGRLAYAWYAEGTDAGTRQEIFSATKSMTSTLVGIAAGEGELSLDQPASDFLTEWKGTPSEAVTIRQLLANDSGRFWSVVSDYGTLLRSPDKTAYALGLDQQHEPGTHWDYNNSAIQTLSAVIQRATGMDLSSYAKVKLFDPIGMGSSIRKDAVGNPLAFMGAQANCEDMARFGLLFERDGVWGDRQVLPDGWVAEATAASQPLNNGYGFLWWRNGTQALGPLGGSQDLATGNALGLAPGGDAGSTTTTAVTGTTFPGGLIWPHAPADAYAALGLGDQIALVIPSRHLVVVRLGRGPGTLAGVLEARMVDELARLAIAADDAQPG
jgi:CubicO group peptidase (beta-lactamase class C family)